MDINKCRVCLGVGTLTDIFCKHGSWNISSKIMSVAKVQMNPNDGLPDKICSSCIERLDNCVEFIDMCVTSDSTLRMLLSTDISKGLTEDVDNQSCWSNKSLADYDAVKFSPKSDTERALIIDETYIDSSLTNTLVNFDVLSDNNACDLKEDTDHDSKRSRRLQCYICGKFMSSKFRLKTHMRIHTGEKPFSCPNCSKNFSLEQSLKIHLRIHTGEKPLKCKICEESFAHSAGLAAHRRKHTGQLPYQCLLCPRSFRTIGHLQYHTRRHTGEKNFECEKCGKAFITRSDLKQHIRSHSGERPHICCICGHRLTREAHLKRHIETQHKDQEIFHCNYCSSKFEYEIDLKKHRQLHEVKISSEHSDSLS